MVGFVDCWWLRLTGVCENNWLGVHDIYYHVMLVLCFVLNLRQLVVIRYDGVCYLCVMKRFRVIYF